MKISTKIIDDACTRRDFIKELTLKSAALGLFSSTILVSCTSSADEKNIKRSYAAILIDYAKCTGCRTCEAVCASFKQSRINKNGKKISGLGNPHYSNIKVYNYNPDVDIPSVCSLCPDTPCIKACPVSANASNTRHNALYRDETLGTIQNNPHVCIGCGNCKDACETSRNGVITLDPETTTPDGICTLCNGSPECVKYCPYGALKFIKSTTDPSVTGKGTDQVAQELFKKWYQI